MTWGKSVQETLVFEIKSDLMSDSNCGVLWNRSDLTTLAESSPAVSSVVSLLLHTVGVPCDDTGSHEVPMTKHKHLVKFCLDNFIQRIQSGNWITHYNNLGIQLNYNKVDNWTTILPRQRRKQAYPLYTERQSRGGGGGPTTLLELERRVSQEVRHIIVWNVCLASRCGTREVDSVTRPPDC